MEDMSHGAISPVDLSKQTLPHCVCQVRTTDKSDGTARFVHNTRHVNQCVAEGETKCELETLLRKRNIFLPGGLVIGSDYKSG